MSTALVTAVEPKRRRTSSSAASSSSLYGLSSGSASWIARPSPRLLTATPTSVMPRRSIIGVATASRSLASEDRVRVGGRPQQRLGAGRTREVVEAEPQDDSPADSPRNPHPEGDAVDERDQGRLYVLQRLRLAAEC